MSRSRFTRMLAVLGASAIAVSGLVGCVGQPGGIQASDSWTIMTYDAGDNDLEQPLLEDLVEKAAVGTQPGFNIVSLMDRAEGYTDMPILGLPDWTGAKLLEIGRGTATELYDYGDLNMGSSATLAAFIRETIRAYPASNYALIISDHGAGWPGIAVDDSHGDVLSMAEVQAGLAQGLAEAGVEKLDLLGFDACLMGTYEVMSMVAPYADRLLASQETIPFHGFDYAALDTAYRGGTVDELGAAMIDAYYAQAVSFGAENDVTLSLIDLTRFAELETAVQDFATAMTSRVENVAPAVGRNLAETLGFGVQPGVNYFLTDLGILAGEISVDAVDVAPQAEQVVRTVNDLVLDNITGQATRGATGVSIYFPPTEGDFQTPYSDLPIDDSWSTFLQTYYDTGASIPSDLLPAFSSGASTEFGDGGVYIYGSFNPALEDNLSFAYFTYAAVNPADGRIAYLGDSPAQFTTDGRGIAAGFYNLSTFDISDGTNSQTAYLSLYDDLEAGLLSLFIPIWYMAPGAGIADGERLSLDITLDPDTGQIVSANYFSYDPATETTGAFTAPPGGTVLPLLLFVDPATGDSTWDVSPSATPLSADLGTHGYSLNPIPSGAQMILELHIQDFGGNGDSVSATITVP